jgi:DNA polymerase Ligase (LigD)
MGNDGHDRFVILVHVTPPGAERGTHWDLMFEQRGVLRTWALAQEPRAGAAIDADQLPDHRIAYLDYEGPISGDRGSVTRWDRGTFELLSDTADEFAAIVAGQRLCGRLRLVPRAGNGRLWEFSFESA